MSDIDYSFVNASFPARAENTEVGWADHVKAHVIAVEFEFRTVMSIYLTDDDARALHEALGASIESRAAQLAEARAVQA